ncbi:MAG: ABC transporter permease [Nocardioidaceae bacterium]|nr:ABC transporter permease [Nocardioidaceae bacterium]
MSPLTHSPAPGAAPMSRMVASHAVMETRLLLRNGEQVLLAVVIPVLVLLGGAEAGNVIDLGSGRRIDVLTPGVMALAVMSTAFTSLAIATAFERRYGVLKLLGASPLPRTGLLLGKVGSLLAVEACQLALIALVGIALGWRPAGGLGGTLGAGLLLLLGTAAFAGLGLLMAGTLRAEATLAAANLVYVVLLAAGAVVLPVSAYPKAMEVVLAVLPSGALAQGLRDVTSGAGLDRTAVVVLTVWAVAAAALTARTFRWD